MSHSQYETMQQLIDPTIQTSVTDSSTDTDSVTAFTFDEIGLLAGVSTPGLDENKIFDGNTCNFSSCVIVSE